MEDNIGKACYICKGPYKGLNGLILTTNKKTVKVELQSRHKIQ